MAAVRVVGRFGRGRAAACVFRRPQGRAVAAVRVVGRVGCNRAAACVFRRPQGCAVAAVRVVGRFGCNRAAACVFRRLRCGGVDLYRLIGHGFRQGNAADADFAVRIAEAEQVEAEPDCRFASGGGLGGQVGGEVEVVAAAAVGVIDAADARSEGFAAVCLYVEQAVAAV